MEDRESCVRSKLNEMSKEWRLGMDCNILMRSELRSPHFTSERSRMWGRRGGVNSSRTAQRSM